MLDLLYDPDGFFEGEAEDPDLIAGAVVVVVAAVLTVTSDLVLLDQLLRAPPPEFGGAGLVRNTTYVGAAVGIAVTLVFWVIATGVFHLVASQTEGEGSFTETLALTGFGYVATIVAGVASLVGAYLALQAAGSPGAAASFLEYSQAINQHPGRQFAWAYTLPILLWQGVLWTYAVKHAYGVSRRQAAVAVAGPVVLVLLAKLIGPAIGLLLGGF